MAGTYAEAAGLYKAAASNVRRLAQEMSVLRAQERDLTVAIAAKMQELRDATATAEAALEELRRLA